MFGRPYDLTIMADTAILDRAAKEVKVPSPRCRRRQEPGLTQGGGGRVHAAIPRLQLRWLEGQTHNLAAEPAAAMAKEFFPGR